MFAAGRKPWRWEIVCLAILFIACGLARFLWWWYLQERG